MYDSLDPELGETEIDFLSSRGRDGGKERGGIEAKEHLVQILLAEGQEHEHGRGSTSIRHF